MFLECIGVAQRHQQIKGGVLANVVEQFDGEVLDIGHDERT